MPTSRIARDWFERRAGGADLDRLGLGLAGPLLTDPLAVPRDVRAGDTPEGEPAIWWKVPPSERPGAPQWASGGAPTQAFWAFLDLADEARAERFVAFARRFGVLGLWPFRTDDGHPVYGLDHWVPSIPETIQTPNRYATSSGDEDWDTLREKLQWLYEPVAEWRRWATWFRATARIGVGLGKGQPAPEPEWAALAHEHPFWPEWGRDAVRFPVDVAMQRRELARVVQRRFLVWSGLVPVFRWDDDRPALTLALGGRHAAPMPTRASMVIHWPENSLFPALVAQLLAVLALGPPVGTCEACGRLHQRKRWPRPDQPTRCGSCREKAERERKRAWAAEDRRKARQPGPPLSRRADSQPDSQTSELRRILADGSAERLA